MVVPVVVNVKVTVLLHVKVAVMIDVKAVLVDVMVAAPGAPDAKVVLAAAIQAAKVIANQLVVPDVEAHVLVALLDVLISVKMHAQEHV